ncbi:MAG: endonuclease domain-containing protein [Anaerolineaceae bacterium]
MNKTAPIKNHSLLHEISKEFRKTPTPSEEKLWRFLSNKRMLGYKFRRQHPIGPFIVDFCCIKTKFIIEVDGEIHESQKDYDQEREMWLKEEGYFVLRFANKQVQENLPAVLNEIKNHLQIEY